jgi:two-component system CheB/CheR fusion protein
VARQTLGFYRDSSAPGELNIAETIDELLDVYNYKLRNGDISVKKDVDPFATVFCSSGEFRQVFSNLILNAIDAMEGNPGRIRVKVRCVRDCVHSGRYGIRMSVGDSGCGIGPQPMARIFDSFYTTKEEVGTGLGLWLTRNIIQKYNGRIRVRSSIEPGRSGTVFSVFWPATADLKAEASAVATQ